MTALTTHALAALEREPGARRVLILPDGADVVLRDAVPIAHALDDALVTLAPATTAALGLRLDATAEAILAAHDCDARDDGETVCSVGVVLWENGLRQRSFEFLDVSPFVRRELEALLAPIADTLEDALRVHVADDEAFSAVRERVRHGVVMAHQRLRQLGVEPPFLVSSMSGRAAVGEAPTDVVRLRAYVDTVRSLLRPIEADAQPPHARIAHAALEDSLLEADVYARALEMRQHRMEATEPPRT